MRPQPTIVGVFLAISLSACRPSAPFESEEKEVSFPPNVIRSTGTVGTGGTIGQAFDRNKVNASEAFQVQKALNTMFRVRLARPADRYEIWKSTSGALVRFIYSPNPFEVYSVQPSTGNSFRVSKEPVHSITETMAVAGRLQTSLWMAMTEQGVPPDMIWRFADVFGSRIDFLTEPRQGDTFRMIWSRDRSDSAVRDGEILGASYKSQSGEEVMAFLLDNDYYDAKGRSMRGQFLRAPLSYRRISSGFTRARYHPVLRYYRPHHGIDYAAPKGTPVQAIGEGRVISAGWDGGLGNAVRLRHGGSYVSIYGHLSRIAKGIRAGSTVTQGQVIGFVGSTGLSTGPHLHFGFESGGRLVDFLRLKFEMKASTVPSKDLDRFAETKKKQLERLSALGNTPRKADVIP